MQAKNQSAKSGRPAKLKISEEEEVKRIICDTSKTDAEIAAEIGTSRRTVLRVRKKIGEQKQRGGARERAGRPKRELPPAEIPPRARHNISMSDFVIWCRSGYKTTSGKNGLQYFCPADEGCKNLPAYTHKPPLMRGQVTAAQFYQK